MVGGWWVVCKAILVFYFGPDQALGLGLRLGPSRTISSVNKVLSKYFTGFFSWVDLGVTVGTPCPAGRLVTWILFAGGQGGLGGGLSIVSLFI